MAEQVQVPHINQQRMMPGFRASAVSMVLSGTIPQLLEDIVEYLALPADDLCRLASVSRDWRMASEKNKIWKLKCQQRDYLFNMFTDAPNQQAVDSPMYSRAKWKSLYVRMEMIKAKMRNGDGIRKKTVMFNFDYADAKWPQWKVSELYFFGVESIQSKSVLVYSMGTGEWLKTLQAPRVICTLAVNRSGEILVTTSRSETAVRIWDVTNGVCMHVIHPQVSSHRRPWTRFMLHNNRLILEENSFQEDAPGEHGEVILRAYDTATGEMVQASATIDNLGYKCACLVGDQNGRYIVTVTNASYLSGMECYALWDIKFLTCKVVVEQPLRNDLETRWLLLDSESESIVSYTVCDLPANQDDMDTVVVWDFQGTIKLQLQQKTAQDRFTDVLISQRKLITLQSRTITVWSLDCGEMEWKFDVSPGQDPAMSPFLDKYVLDHSVQFRPPAYDRPRWLMAYVRRVMGADLPHYQNMACSRLHHSIHIITHEPSSASTRRNMQCHTIDCDVPYP